jgi:regulatory protein
VPGEYPSARRRSGQRTRGRRAASRRDTFESNAIGSGRGPAPDEDGGEAGGEPASSQLAWSDAWTAQDQEEQKETRRERGNGRGKGREKPAEPADPESQARQICLNQLSYAPKTRSQLREALIKREIPEDIADEVLGRFAEVGLIDDAAFAKAWVESRHYGKGLAGRALKAELRRRGVDNDDIDEAVAAIDPDSEAETARRLVDRKLSSTRGLPTDTRTRRLAGMLARKGYPAGLAFRVIREALDAEGVAGEEAEAVLGEDTPGEWY